ncbi:protein kinase family protein [Acetobacterium wieringae]|uniref:protein kinase family protein n=1 Tax=Acetobacterium wieringae TaxID=52694 RepID=UPI002B2007CF|nr:protein kinase family protein [Acetobacterium wieringae]MEA4804937.1 protein kinase family protein [Acetobacterium wieringae]
MKSPYLLTRSNGSRLTTLRGALALDGFALVKLLGQGRFGCSYLISREDQDYVAKIFHPNDVKRRKRKLNWEIKFLRTIDHSAIPKLIQVIDRDGCFGLVMQKMPGQTLEDWLACDYAFGKSEIAIIFFQLIAVMDYLADLGISHRDIKADNILWTGEQLSLIDFGSARKMVSLDARFNPDFWGVGDVFMRLALSCDEIATNPNNSGIEQFDLTEEERLVIKRLLYIEKPYQNFRVLRAAVKQHWT